MRTKTKIGRTYIFNMRRNRRLLQKHVATLLGHQHTFMLSKYERGLSLPPLQSAIVLEIALGARLPELYPEMYQGLQDQILERAKSLPPELWQDLRGRLLGKDDHDDT